MRNGETSWLRRLVDFQEAVRRALGAFSPTKYLGDGILCFFPKTKVSPQEILQTARRIIDEIDRVNQQRSHRAEHALHVRVVLNYGRVFLLFKEHDPQGTPVDKLFRMEKFVPGDCIGMTEEFNDLVRCTDCELAGHYGLKGLAEGRHALFLIGPGGKTVSAVINKARRRAALHDFWDLGTSCEGKIYLVTGHIPPEEGQQSMIQMGDKDAMLIAYRSLCLTGRLEDVEQLTSHGMSDAHLRENVVSIGGPYWNQVTRRFMREVSSPFVFDFSSFSDDRSPLIDCLIQRSYSSTWASSRVTRDYGFFARFKNPFNIERHVILACGIETHAVMGILQAFCEDTNQHFLKLHDAIVRGAPDVERNEFGLPDFFALMEFGVEATGSVHLPTADDQIKRVVFDWKTGHNSQLQEAPIE
jgi:hypothetical protein